MSRDDLRFNIDRLEDPELIERYRSGMFSEEARPIAEEILRSRGFDVSKPLPDLLGAEVIAETAAVAQAKKNANPYMVPFIFGASAAPLGGVLGSALVGTVGAAIAAGGFFFLGWRVGRGLALAARGWSHSSMVRTIVLISATLAWAVALTLLLNFAKILRGAP